MNIQSIDLRILRFIRIATEPMARWGLFVIYVWFGALKVFGLSPATPLVHALFNSTLSFLNFDYFIILFGAFEVFVGLLFVVKGYERIVFFLLIIHMVTTVLPLFILPHIAWSGIFVPTLEGQYIIKNLALVAAAMGIVSHLHTKNI